MGEVVLLKKRRVTGRQSITFASVSNNCIALNPGQIQPLSLSLDLAKCNLDNSTKAAWVCVWYKCVAQKVKPVP
jgi:hypothetical protein